MIISNPNAITTAVKFQGEYAHCGFPEKAYGKFAGILIEKGYKVARVEQTETPDMNAERVKKSKQFAFPTQFYSCNIQLIQKKLHSEKVNQVRQGRHQGNLSDRHKGHESSDGSEQRGTNAQLQLPDESR